MAPQVLAGKYELREEIASGGMGIIYKAFDHKLHDTVVIKLVHTHLSSDPSFAERFLREARAMAKLRQHENIVKIYAVEEEAKTQFLVMEYCPGSNLRSMIRKETPLPARNVVHIAQQLASALAYAHAEGVIHRDIKPANVLFDKRGKVKLTDFGISAALDEARITRPREVIGTPEYMSPEQARGLELDGRSDLYSLGVVMYEMLTGKTPYGESSGTSIFCRLAHDREELILQFPSHVSTMLQDVVRDLLRRNPDDRISDAEALASQLHEILYTLPQASLPTAPRDLESTIVLPMPSQQPEEPTRPISTDPGTVVIPPTSPQHKQPGTPAAQPSDRRPVPPPPQKQPTYIVPESPLPPPPAPPSSSAKSLVYGGLILVVALVGVVWYLGSQSNNPTPVISTPDTNGSSPLPSEQKAAQLKEKLKILEATLSDSERLVRTISNQLEKEQLTANCPNLKTGLLETYEKYENTLREVIRVRLELKQEAVSPISRPSLLDLVCDDLKPSSPPPKPSPEPPASPHVAKTFPDNQLVSLVEQFKQAYERRDLKTLHSLSRMNEARERNLETMFRNYATLKLSIAGITPENNGATALVVIDTATTPSGETIDLPPIAKNIKLHIPRQGEVWDKIVW